ncbi:hypothetical protein GCM10009601_23100 [Streptomyces thermospinosisporus]|uniref:Uncharacterized protein n=1 Tax=Streptomyces thermospinosisporus TaxID=161482 RepID=A0ABP4JHI7_9ACTN
MVEIDFGHRRPELPERAGLPGLALGSWTRSAWPPPAAQRGSGMPATGTPARITRITRDAEGGIGGSTLHPDGVHEVTGEFADDHAPHGPRGAGEAPTLSSTPAIPAATRDATGPEPSRAPVRPEHLTGTV